MIETFVQVTNMKQLERLQKKYSNVNLRKFYNGTLYVYVGGRFVCAGWTKPDKYITFDEWKLLQKMGIK